MMWQPHRIHHIHRNVYRPAHQPLCVHVLSQNHWLAMIANKTIVETHKSGAKKGRRYGALNGDKMMRHCAISRCRPV